MKKIHIYIFIIVMSAAWICNAQSEDGVVRPMTKADFKKQCGFYGEWEFMYTPLISDYTKVLTNVYRFDGLMSLGARIRYFLVFAQSECEYWQTNADNVTVHQMFLRSYFSFGYDIRNLFKFTLSLGGTAFSSGTSLFDSDMFFGPGIDFRLYVGPDTFYISTDFFIKTDLLFNAQSAFLSNLYFGMRLNFFPYIQSLSLFVEPAFQVSLSEDTFLGGKFMTFCLSVGVKVTTDVARIRDRLNAWKNHKHFGDFYRLAKSPRDNKKRAGWDEPYRIAGKTKTAAPTVPQNKRNYINIPDADFVRVKSVTFIADQSEGAFKASGETVTIPEYFICKYEVTQALYRKVMSHDRMSEPNPSYNSPSNKDTVAFDDENVDMRPVECVTWYDAVYFCNAYSRRQCFDEVYTIKNIERDEGRHIVSAVVTADFSKNGYRLPTEAEWECAARGGDPTNPIEWNHVYSGGDDMNAVGWYYDNCASHGAGNRGYGSHQVAQHIPNKLGIYDMSGNVSEWCWDETAGSRKSRRKNDNDSQTQMRILCGGNWHNDAEACAITYRDYTDTWKGLGHTYDGLGFRLVRSSIRTDSRLSPRVILNGDFKLVPGRTFRPNEQEGAFAGVDEVTIADYYMSLYPVTQALYRYVMRDEPECNIEPSFCAMDNGIHVPSDDEMPQLRPVEYVSWYDAVYFCNVYSRIQGYQPVYTVSNVIRDRDGHIVSANVTADVSKDGYRLPTEMEWEYAARGANPNDTHRWNAPYSGSYSADAAAWYFNNAGDRIGRGNEGYGTHEVGMRQPNSLGIYDMSGNVWEWCQTASGNTARKTSRPGIARKEYHICRGGSWFRNETFCRTLSRNDWLPDQWASDMGFRVVRTRIAKAEKIQQSVTDVKFDFVRVPHGTVRCSDTEGVFAEDRGVVQVRGFLISRYEVTQSLYASVLFGDRQSNPSPSGCTASDGQYPVVSGESESLRPVDNVTWYDAVYFCNAYSRYDRLEPVYTISAIQRDKTGHITRAAVTADFSKSGYRLPTEIEWEYAARGGSQSSPSWDYAYSGSNAAYDVAWYKENAGYAIGAGNLGYGSHQIGRRTANSLGIYDMSGNAAEMCWDRYTQRLDASVGLSGPTDGISNVIKGGSWSDAPYACTVTARLGVNPEMHYVNYGFRVVKADPDDSYDESDKDADFGHSSVGDGFVRIPAASIQCDQTSGAFASQRGRINIAEYYISKYPVTIALYQQVMSKTPEANASPSVSSKNPGFEKMLKDEIQDLRPVENVSWYDAAAFCNAYSEQQGLEPVYTITDIVRDTAFGSIRSASVSADFSKHGYRLPTRAEWEYAARGANPMDKSWQYKYAGSNDIDEVCWYWRNIHGGFGKKVISSGARGYGSHQTGLKKANTIGLYDMCGNVQQWCWDWYSESIDADTPLTGPNQGSYRVACGGAWNFEENDCTVVSYTGDFPNDCDDNRGFRLVRTGDAGSIEVHSVVMGEFADIDGGTFRMGDDTRYGTSSNKPHNVTVDSFSIGITPVTAQQWESLMDDNPSYHKSAAAGESAAMLPVENISWHDALRYCNLLSINCGLTPCYSVSGETDPHLWTDMSHIEWDKKADGYRLPTEAEWEYAARGGALSGQQTNVMFSGSTGQDAVSWYESNSSARTHQVGLKQPNALGLSDMSGNIWEWCWDWYGADYYEDNQHNPTGPTEGKMRCNRGGAYDSYGADAVIGYRSYDYPTGRFRNVGLRLARNIPE